MNEPPVALTVGVFDGVHRGHQHLIHRMVAWAREHEVQTACVTLDPDPEVVLRPGRPHPALSSAEERSSLLLGLGVRRVEIVRFTEELARQTPQEFVQGLRRRYELRALWAGSDFALGRDRAGTLEMLREIGVDLGFEVVAVDPLREGSRVISSTWIRELLTEGNVAVCTQLLGRPYCIEGVVAPGMRRGHEIGFPTANIAPPPDKAMPADGVYLVRVTMPRDGEAQDCHGVVNLGGRPTFGEVERLLETHVLDFDGELYGTRLRLCFLRQLRGVQRFSGVEELRAQIERDVALARELIASADSASPLAAEGEGGG